MSNNKTNLDELDTRFFKELPFLLDVFASSFNRLKEIFSIHFELIEKDITAFTNKNPDWKKGNAADTFTPFYSSNDKPKFLEFLSSEFTFDKTIKIVSQSTSITLQVSCGYWCSDWAEGNKPFLYFGIYRWKADTAMIPLSFYSSLDLSNYKKEIKHPSDGSKEESIEIQIFEIHNEALKEGFCTFSQNILKPYLRELENLNNKLKFVEM